MIVTVTNTSATSPGGPVTLNKLVTYNGATGAAMQVALPYPFNADGGSAAPVQFPFTNVLAGGTLVLPMHENDWHYKRVPWLPSEPHTDWNFLINAGIVSMGFVDETSATISAQSTTIAAGSNGLSLPQSTINVAATAGFASSGVIAVTTSAGVQQVYYTGTTGTTFTGCTGGTGQMSTGGAVAYYAHGIALGDVEDLFVHTL